MGLLDSKGILIKMHFKVCSGILYLKGTKKSAPSRYLWLLQNVQATWYHTSKDERGVRFWFPL